ncbi:MAG: hypothetical protein IJ055_09035 [Oscillospiraceae bacterium]|nr:hypothetical protein [Oscillospiraceae bacterium]
MTDQGRHPACRSASPGGTDETNDRLHSMQGWWELRGASGYYQIDGEQILAFEHPSSYQNDLYVKKDFLQTHLKTNRTGKIKFKFTLTLIRVYSIGMKSS